MFDNRQSEGGELENKQLHLWAHQYRAGRPIGRKILCSMRVAELRGPAWAVGTYSISQTAGGTSQNIIFKTLRQIGRPTLFLKS